MVVHRFLFVSLTCLAAVKSSHLQVVALAITNYERWHDYTKAESAVCPVARCCLLDPLNGPDQETAYSFYKRSTFVYAQEFSHRFAVCAFSSPVLFTHSENSIASIKRYSQLSWSPSSIDTVESHPWSLTYRDANHFDSNWMIESFSRSIKTIYRLYLFNPIYVIRLTYI